MTRWLYLTGTIIMVFGSALRLIAAADWIVVYAVVAVGLGCVVVASIVPYIRKTPNE